MRDVLTEGVQAPGKAKHQLAGSHVALAGPGRTGHVIWKTGIYRKAACFDPYGSTDLQTYGALLACGGSGRRRHSRCDS